MQAKENPPLMKGMGVFQWALLEGTCHKHILNHIHRMKKWIVFTSTDFQKETSSVQLMVRCLETTFFIFQQTETKIKSNLVLKSFLSSNIIRFTNSKMCFTIRTLKHKNVITKITMKSTTTIKGDLQPTQLYRPVKAHITLYSDNRRTVHPRCHWRIYIFEYDEELL